MKYKLALEIKIPFFILLFFFSCKMSDDVRLKLIVHPEVELNYLIYMAADNNLERFGIKNIKALQEIGSNNNTNIIILFDRSPGYDKSENNRSETDLFVITKNPKTMNEDIVFEYGELDMTSSETLYSFLITINHYYPAKHTVLNIWSHARGLYPDGIISRGIIEDYTTGYGAKNMMSIYDFSKCIKEYEAASNKYVDIIQFDACDMQMLEIAYQLRGLTDYVVGAETEIPGEGSNYKAIAEYLYTDKAFNAQNFAFYLVDSFYARYSQTSYEFSYSAVDLKYLNTFINKFNTFCNELIANSFENMSEIKQIRSTLSSTDSSYTEFVDLYEFVSKINLLILPTSLTKADFLKVIPRFGASSNYIDKFLGLAINFPNTQAEQSYYRVDQQTDYIELYFYIETKWADFLSVYWSN